MEQKRSSSRSRKSSKSSSASGGVGGGGGGGGGLGRGGDREEAEQRSRYKTKIEESATRLSKYTAENDRLLDEVSNLRLQMREMKNDRSELVRAHHESMSLLAQVSEEKLVEFKSKSEQEAIESKAAQEEALRTVLEMMEKDCEDRVAELDSELARVEEERERAARLQIEAASSLEAEATNKTEMEEAARLAVQKLVAERATRDREVVALEGRERELRQELEATRQKAERDMRAAEEAVRIAESVSTASTGTTDDDGMGGGGGGPGGGGGGGSALVPGGDMNAAGGGGGGDLPHPPPSDSDDNDSYSEPRSEEGSDDHASPPLDRERGGGGGGGGGGSGRDRSPPRRPEIVQRAVARSPVPSPFLNDPRRGMTRGRRIALALSNAGWYRPRGPGRWDEDGIGLKSAWAYFEHSVLPRHVDGDGVASAAAGQDGEGGGGARKRGRVSVYESDGGSTDMDERASDGGDTDSDVDDWLYQSKSSSGKNGRGGGGDRGGGGGKKRGKGFLCCGKTDLKRAEPGETGLPTRLYSPLFTPLSELGDFGIGLGLYFSSLRAVAFITLVAGCINLPNIMYFASDEYSKQQPNVNIMLKGSAVCTEQAWVPCPTCTTDQFPGAAGRIAGATTVTPDGELQTLVFAMKNACDGAKFQVGIVNMASLGFILLAMVILSLYQRRKQIAFDEQEQTAQDYSIEIQNPPPDATAPEEWKEFFESRFGGHLTCCTVTIDNDLLVKALAERREVLFEVEEKLREGATIDAMSLSELGAKIEHGRKFLGKFKSRLSPGIPELVGRLAVLNARIQGLAQQEYRATRVFCTFETEGAQRQVLARMTVGSLAASRNRTHKINPNLLFRGERVLLVREAEEPDAVRWMDLDESWTARCKQQALGTIVSLACVAGVALVVYLCRQFGGPAYAAVAISISNASFPAIAKALTDLEAHASETGKQSSLLVKIAVFRWVVTAIIITIITPFTSTITNGPEHLLQSIWIIFSSDLFTTNFFQLIDPAGNFKRHFLAPRAGSQERMNLLMSGTEYTIAERYTNMTKTLFLTFYYCAIYPSAFFLCSFTLIINFYVDKFSIMRTWRPAPMLGPYIANFSRAYFMTSAIAALALVSSYLFSGFPFDNLCAEDVTHSAYYGKWKVTDGEGRDSTAMIEPVTRSYHFCNQFLGPGSNFAFPALPDAQSWDSSWMTAEQEQLTGIYGWVSVGVLGLVGLTFLYRVLKKIQDIFSASYKPNGDVQGQAFSKVEAISSYIPQIRSNHFTHPLLAVNIDDVDESIFDWSDPVRSYSYYDMTRDAEQLLKGNGDVCYSAFSQIRHWPPGGVDMEQRGQSTKSALRKSKDINKRGNNVSWSSKVTCKTYSKDDPNNDAFGFNANASTSEGMNFKGHSDPLYDPHAQNEARVITDNPQNNDAVPVNNFDPFAPTSNDNFQDNGHGHQQQQNQPPPDNQHFDQYYNTGLDYPNQPADPMYGDSQNQDNGAYQGDPQIVDPQNQDHGDSWESSSQGTGSQGQSGSSGSYTRSSSEGTGSYSEGTGSYSDTSSHQSGTSDPNNNGNEGYGDEEASGGTYEDSRSDGSRHSSNVSSGSFSAEEGNPDHDGADEYDEAEIYEDDQDWDEANDDEQGSFSTGHGSYSTGHGSNSTGSSGLPPVT